MKQETTFYRDLQKSEALDLRDNRGKRHDLSLVLTNLVVALLRRRDGTLSSIYRSMKNMQKHLCKALGVENKAVVSRSHLPILLSKVNVELFADLLLAHYGIE